MGEVYVARTPWDQHRVAAVKRLRPDVARVPTFAERFQHESQLAVRLEHPNVVGTIDVGSVDGQLYVASDLVLGKDAGLIADRLRERGQGAPVAVVVRLLIDILDGLAYVHGAREPDGRWLALVHRDVTPGNVLIGYDGVARLADFGLAKSALTEAANLTGHGEILGTPHYLAPEVIRGQRADKSADIYGLGAVVYRVLTGVAPYQGTTAEVLFKALSEEPRPLLEWRPDLPKWFADFVEELLDREPKRRPFDAALLKRRLEHDASAAKLLLPQASVGRWLTQLFEDERSREVEEYEAISAVDPRSVPGEGKGTVVLAHAYSESALEAPAPVPSGADLENLGTELDLAGGALEVAGDLPERLRRRPPVVDLGRGGDSDTIGVRALGLSSGPGSFSDELEVLPTFAAPMTLERSGELPEIRGSSFGDGSPSEHFTTRTSDIDEETRPVEDLGLSRPEADPAWLAALHARSAGSSPAGGDTDDRTQEEGKKSAKNRPLPGFAGDRPALEPPSEPVEEIATAITDLELNKRMRPEDRGAQVRVRSPDSVVVSPLAAKPEGPRPVLPQAAGLPRPVEERPLPPRPVKPVIPVPERGLDRPVPEPRVPDPARTDERVRVMKQQRSRWISVLSAALAAALAIGSGIAIGLWLSGMRESVPIAAEQSELVGRFELINRRIKDLAAGGEVISPEVTRQVADAAAALMSGELERADVMITELERTLQLPTPQALR